MRNLRKKLTDTHGAISTEYLVIVGAVGLLFMTAVVALGPRLVTNYENTRSTIASPYP